MTKNKTFMLLLIMVLAGCVGSKTAPAQIDSEPTQTTQVVLSPTEEPARTKTLSPTLTKTATMTLTPTEVKKSKEERDAWLKEKILQPECQLPCFWGITPGETSWEDVVEEVSPYADEVANGDADGEYEWYGFYFYSPPEEITGGILTLGILYETERIFKVNGGMSIENVSMYSLPVILSQYGPPGEVWLTAYSGYALDDRYPRPSTMHILYPEIGLLLTYSGPPGQVEDGIIKNCLEWGPSLEIWAPGELPDIETFDERFVFMEYPYLHIKEALGMDVEMFYETYIGEPGDVCFETQADLWTWGTTETAP